MKNSNIYFENSDFELLKQKISQFQNQTVHIVISPEYQADGEILYGLLKRNYQVNISYISHQMCYSLSGLNTLWCSMKENTRLLIALGNEHIHNITKLLSNKSNVPYCFLSRDFPNLYSMGQGIILGAPINSSSAKCLFKNYNLENISATTLAYSTAQCFSTLILPFLNFLSAKINSTNFNAEPSNALFKDIQKILSLKKIFSLSPQATLSLCKIVLNISQTLPHFQSNPIFSISQNYVHNQCINVQKLPLYAFFTTQTLSKILFMYFENNLISPLCVPLEKLNAPFPNFNQDKLEYIIKTYKKNITTYYIKLNKLQPIFSKFIKNILPDSGYTDFNEVNYKNLIAFIKNELIQNNYKTLKLVEII